MFGFNNTGRIEELLQHDAMSVLMPSLVFICILIAVGIPGNILALTVYAFQLKKATGRYAIMALAICDIINGVLSIPVEIFIITNYWTFEYASLCKLSRFMTYAMNNSSGLILLAIAIERYRAICTPHKPKFQESFILKCCVVLVMFGTFLATPALFIYGIQTDSVRYPDVVKDDIKVVDAQTYAREIAAYMTGDDVNADGIPYITTKRCLIDNAWRGSAFAYSHFAFVAIASIIVLLVMIGIYARVGKTIFGLRNVSQHCPDQERLRSSNKKKIQSTLVLFLITLAFQFSFIPFVIISNIRFFTEPNWYNNISRAGQMSYHLFLRSYYFNCAVNPFIYGLSSKNFRSAVVLQCKRAKAYITKEKCDTM